MALSYSKASRGLLVALLWLLPLPVCRPQARSLGTVTDPSGAVIPNAKVTATRVGTGVSQSTVTSTAGLLGMPRGGDLTAGQGVLPPRRNSH